MNGRFFAVGCIGFGFALVVWGCAEPEPLHVSALGGKKASSLGSGGNKSGQGGATATETTGSGGQKVGQGGASETGATSSGGRKPAQGGGSQTDPTGSGGTVIASGGASSATTDPTATTGGVPGTTDPLGGGGSTDTTPLIGVAGGEACNNTSPTPCGLKSQYCQANVCACPTNQTVCGTACVGLAYDNANCGKCGVVCATPRWCDNGKCNG